MWLPKDVLSQVDDLATFHYVDANATRRWNDHRREGELRLLTGWAWTAKVGNEHRGGFKTITVAYRDAFYSLVRREVAPITRRPRLRVVARRAA